MEQQKNYHHLLTALGVGTVTCLGIGYIPLGGGTFSALGAMLLYMIIENSLVFFLLTLGVIAVAFSLSGWAEGIFGQKDSPKIVIDDFAGMMVSLLFIPNTPSYLFVAFFLFRTLDFLKIYPLNRIENLNGSIAVVGDDLLAGIYTNIFINLSRLIVLGR